MPRHLPAPHRRQHLLNIKGLSRPRGSLTGVCAGIARYFNVNPALVRLAFVIATPFTSGINLLAYMGLAIFMPKDSEEQETPPQRPSTNTAIAPTLQELCPNCDTVSHPYARYCHRCGTPLVE